MGIHHRVQSPTVRTLAFCLLAFAVASSCAHPQSATSISRSLPSGSDRGPDGAEEAASAPESARASEVLFDWPVDSARLTRGFMPAKRRPHLGIDLAANRGTPILAARGGLVIYRGRDFRGFGKMVLIESGDGWATLYAHLDKFYVNEGQRVAMGEMVGAMGRTGRASGNHLHFEIRKERGPVDPLPLLPRVRTN